MAKAFIEVSHRRSVYRLFLKDLKKVSFLHKTPVPLVPTYIDSSSHKNSFRNSNIDEGVPAFTAASN